MSSMAEQHIKSLEKHLAMKDTEIERLTNENEEMVKCAELEEKHTNEVIAEHGMEYEQEIEQLKKEKEWMLDVLAEHYIDEVDPFVTECEARDSIIKEMQKALKEK